MKPRVPSRVPDSLDDAWRTLKRELDASDDARVLDRVATDVSVNVGGETLLYQKLIDGNILGQFSKLRLALTMKGSDATAALNAGGPTFRLKYGGTTVATTQYITHSGDNTVGITLGANFGFELGCELVGDGLTQQQLGLITIKGPMEVLRQAGPPDVLAALCGYCIGTNRGTVSKDSSAQQLLSVTVQGAAAALVIVMEHAVLEGL